MLWDQRSWTNWSGDVKVWPLRHCYPQTLQELVTLVREAEAALPPRRIRAVGSGWAFSAPGATDECLVETRRLDQILTGVLSQSPIDALTARSGYCHVEAGILLSDLEVRLDGGRRGLRNGVQRPDRDPGRESWALPTIPGASGQTVAGAMSTGTHGTDVNLPPLADWIRAIHLVGPGGVQHWIEADKPIASENAVRRAYPDIHVHHDTELLHAAQVSVGRFGIIYSLVIEVIPQYGLREVRRAATWTAVSADLADGSLLTTARAVQTVIDPYRNSAGTHACYVTERSETADVPAHSRNVLGRILSRVPDAIRWRPGDAVASLCDAANRRGRATVTRQLVSWVLSFALRPATQQGRSHELLTRQAWIDEWFRGHSVEIFFDATGAEYLKVITDHLLPLIAAYADDAAAIAGWVSLRFMGRSDATLAMQRWDRTVAVEVAVLRGIHGSIEVLAAVEALAVAHGGTVHWGQQNTLDLTAVEMLFPNIVTWRAQLDKLNVPGVGSLTFENEFCRQRGLTTQ